MIYILRSHGDMGHHHDTLLIHPTKTFTEEEFQRLANRTSNEFFDEVHCYLKQVCDPTRIDPYFVNFHEPNEENYVDITHIKEPLQRMLDLGFVEPETTLAGGWTDEEDYYGMAHNPYYDYEKYEEQQRLKREAEEAKKKEETKEQRKKMEPLHQKVREAFQKGHEIIVDWGGPWNTRYHQQIHSLEKLEAYLADDDCLFDEITISDYPIRYSEHELRPF